MSVEAETPVIVEAGLDGPHIDEKAGSSTPSTIVSPGENGDNEKNTETRKLPFYEPAPSATIPSRVELSAGEEEKYNIVLEHLKSITSLPVSSSKKEKETAPLSEAEQCFLTRECILRYLRATKWNVNEAKKRLEGTIVWRREYGTDTLTSETVEPEVSSSLTALLTFGLDRETSLIGIR
jgi:hypothetical protein